MDERELERELAQALLNLQRCDFELRLLNSRNWMRVMRWPGAGSVTISLLCHQAVYWAGGQLWARFLAGFLGGFVAMWWLMSRAWRRYAQRAWNSLEA